MVRIDSNMIVEVFFVFIVFLKTLNKNKKALFAEYINQSICIIINTGKKTL